MEHDLTCGALFAGIGGFCFGMEKAGFKTLWATDIDAEATETYSKNFKHVEVINDDIIEMNRRSIRLQPVDVVHAGFPCQSFSAAGNRKGFDDPRGRLFYEVVNFIRNQGDDRPSVILLENAVNLLYGGNGSWFDTIRLELQRLGYWFSPENAAVIDARTHGGLPQRRERLFMVALSRDHFPLNPFFGVKKANKVEDLKKLFEPEGRVTDNYFLPSTNKYGNMLLEECRKLPKGSLIQLRQSIMRPQPPGMCPTLTANMGKGGHNVPFLIDEGRLRKLTERECLRLQGFPAKFKFAEMTMSSRYRLIGNAVSPKVAAKIGKEIAGIHGTTTSEDRMVV